MFCREDVHCWSLEALVGYTLNGRLGGKGGIVTILGAKWRKFLNASDEVMNNRGFWFIFSGEIGFINVYMPKEPLYYYVL